MRHADDRLRAYPHLNYTPSLGAAALVLGAAFAAIGCVMSSLRLIARVQ
jgi:hypothetical protein